MTAEGRLRKETNWYVITGGPSSGKTTTINLLAARGYKTIKENARHYIDTQRLKGKSVDEIVVNQEAFQMEVLRIQIEQEALLTPSDTVFLDRAIPDALAYCYFLQLPISQTLMEAVQAYQYKKVFIMYCLPLVQDYARKEDEQAQKKLHTLLIEVYTSLHFPVIHVPVLSTESRVDFILNNL